MFTGPIFKASFEVCWLNNHQYPHGNKPTLCQHVAQIFIPTGEQNDTEVSAVQQTFQFLAYFSGILMASLKSKVTKYNQFWEIGRLNSVGLFLYGYMSLKTSLFNHLWTIIAHLNTVVTRITWLLLFCVHWESAGINHDGMTLDRMSLNNAHNEIRGKMNTFKKERAKGVMIIFIVS